MKKFLTTKQRNELLEELRLEKLRRYAERIKVILLLDEGRTYKDISAFLFLDEGTIANWRKRYRKGGLDMLVNDEYGGRRTKLSEKELKILDEDLQQKVFLTTKSVITHVKSKFGVEYTRGGITELLHRLGFSFKKPKAVPGKANREKQEKFIEEYRKLSSKGEVVYFGDASHPMFNTALNYGWIKKGKEFEVKTNSGRKRLNIVGAVEIRGLKILSRSYDTVNKDSMCNFLNALRGSHPDGEKITLILDNAGSNKASKVRFKAEGLGIKIVYLPSYSPNLNPVERLWKFMRKKAAPNEYFQNFEDWRAAVMGFFRGIRRYRSELERLITDNFELMGT